MSKRNKVIGLVIGILVSSQGIANADFSDEFAPSKWTYTATGTPYQSNPVYGPSGTLSTSLMTLIAADGPVRTAAQVGSYSIIVPVGVSSITFDYLYKTDDCCGSVWDMATYTVGTTETNLVLSNGTVGLTQSGTITLTDVAGKLLSINQKTPDAVAGIATTKITKFTAKINQGSNSNVVLSESKPVISADAKSYSCKPGAYTFMRYGITKETSIPTTLVYTLIMNGTRVSTISTDNWVGLSKSIVDPSNNSVTGTATSTAATWAVDGANTKSAQCEVLAYQDSATMLAYSNNL